MMGRLSGDQDRLFYQFYLDDVVPHDHLVRQIDRVLGLGWLHGGLAAFYSHSRQPSIDPEPMVRMLIVGYVFAIRSERQLCAGGQVNLAYRWFCHLSIEARFLTTLSFRAPGASFSARAKYFGVCLNAWWPVAFWRTLLVERPFRWTRRGPVRFETPKLGRRYGI